MFHIYLKSKGKTTYEWVTDKRVQKAIKNASKSAGNISSAESSGVDIVPDESNQIGTKITKRHCITNAKQAKKI